MVCVICNKINRWSMRHVQCTADNFSKSLNNLEKSIGFISSKATFDRNYVSEAFSIGQRYGKGLVHDSLTKIGEKKRSDRNRTSIKVAKMWNITVYWLSYSLSMHGGLLNWLLYPLTSIRAAIYMQIDEYSLVSMRIPALLLLQFLLSWTQIQNAYFAHYPFHMWELWRNKLQQKTFKETYIECYGTMVASAKVRFNDTSVIKSIIVSVR